MLHKYAVLVLVSLMIIKTVFKKALVFFYMLTGKIVNWHAKIVGF